jgi:uncharacterized NAD(P)/FAD-binding protein YdhS
MKKDTFDTCIFMKTILIIGAGFSGAVTAVHLLRQPAQSGVRVLLVNRSGRMARGIAYGTKSPNHLLNVPAGNMSALPDDPDHFLRFCQRVDASITASSFVSRQIYGDYLEHLLNQAELAACSGRFLERIAGEVIDIVHAPDRHGCRITLADGQNFHVDRLVLACGHYPPNDPHTHTPDFYNSARYIKDPWKAGALDAVAPSESILLLGTGLTAIDVSLMLLNRHDTRAIHAISRRGLLPLPHRVSRAPNYDCTLPDFSGDAAISVRKQLRMLRRHIDAETSAGGDWRDTIAALRPHTQALWQQLSEPERKRFLRHLQPYWDNHRHRVAPQPYAHFQQAIASRHVNILAGRTMTYEESHRGVCVTIRVRSTQNTVMLDVDRVINCTGPGSDLNRVDDALVRQLLKRGLIRRDPLGLGLDVSDCSALIDAQGNASNLMYYVGPLLKARYWEAVAVPELRGFSQRLAKVLLHEESSAVAAHAVAEMSRI